MKSFKLTQQSGKKEAISAGTLLVVLGLFAALLIHPIGLIMAVAGVIMLVAGLGSD